MNVLFSYVFVFLVGYCIVWFIRNSYAQRHINKWYNHYRNVVAHKGVVLKLATKPGFFFTTYCICGDEIWIERNPAGTLNLLKRIKQNKVNNLALRLLTNTYPDMP